MKYLKSYRKAIIGGVSAGVTALAAVLSHGNPTGDDWRNVVIAALVGAGLVWVVPNTDPRPATPPASTPPVA